MGVNADVGNVGTVTLMLVYTVARGLDVKGHLDAGAGIYSVCGLPQPTITVNKTS